MSVLTLRILPLMALASLLSACFSVVPTRLATTTEPLQPALTAAVHTQITQFEPRMPCTGAFVAHDLEHITQTALPTPRLFDSNGGGVAVNDVDGDGDQDIVLANLAGPVSILWNQGGLQFERQELGVLRKTRAVAWVDVDGDGLLDLVLTNGIAAPALLRNNGSLTFALTPLPGVNRPAYAMNWSDLDGDGDLDLVTGSYDAARQMETGSNYLFSASAGVNVYLQTGDLWHSRQLTGTAQALAIGLWDLDNDARPDIWVGNDFDETDQIWLQRAEGWQLAEPFDDVSHSTMSIDRGDLNRDGVAEYFTTDMKPYATTPQVLAGWMPLMDAATKTRQRNDPQISENVLQVWRNGRFVNEAYDRKIDATGWSWSGKFGDLDNDGDLDLYVVNGMIAADLLGYLSNSALIEENQALRNDGHGQFLVADDWALGSERSGRGMSMADFDDDGDLDIVVNNLHSPAQLFENRLCTEGAALAVDLRWPDSSNPFAIGATVHLHTDHGVLLRDVRAMSGYLSGDPTQLHFGIATGNSVDLLEIRWPDGARSTVEQPPLGYRISVTREP